MKYQLTNAVWEITMKCNMRCQHCGSSCEEAMEDELTTEEALELCDDLKELGLKYITISGGELTTRKDWHLIAKKLVENGIVTSMITNGWIMSDDTVQKAKEAGINTIAISIDGCQETHDKIRKPGSFERDIENFKRIKESGIIPAAITTIQKQNVDELEELYQILKEAGVLTWQLQIALPMGNFKKHMEECIEPADVLKVVDFAYSKIEEDMTIDLADSIGFYSKKDTALMRKRFGKDAYWQGCSAGKCNIGILNNGDIVGCTSIRGKEFIEGNIRKTKLKEIWNSEESFKWNRCFTRNDLKGLCKECQYADYCLGGCANLRYCMNGDVCSENTYCIYNMQLNEYKKKIQKLCTLQELESLLYFMLDKKQIQVAGMVADRIEELGITSEGIQQNLGFLYYSKGDYQTCATINQKILEQNPQNKYAKKGLGLAVYQLGDVEKGIQLMYEALDKDYMDSYSDLYLVLKEQKREKEAEALKQEMDKLEK
ncbi:radical SAM/SPASM domain-containing protein [[Clostridium] polysaccharolyticum]|jgi:radical SAM protein with 4Fe4S-binding SPASM domain|uniref:Radical SAM additional 4Fe4S-binding SPASM domain-containing protein n=1 Tax=[Clostridium] polysaccharolyticum TaxID=29364 RepID=A0A1I0D1J0_9FIRM|nr:radical SAM protein [[Clostridium] polysaccharolyticum]SET26035.1 radical SAM additional 4Fe4S-binding SPASM domain-containing protein [[Clostridium] polysaccharolyticum]